MCYIDTVFVLVGQIVMYNDTVITPVDRKVGTTKEWHPTDAKVNELSKVATCS